ncbi:MAG: ADP-ribosylglycohydrolase family protein, partial [Acidimicrobiales bacterium]
MSVDRTAVANAWKGRISGCQLGKPVERMSMRNGLENLRQFLEQVDALPLRDYVPYAEGRSLYQPSCRGRMVRSEPDDDINYSVLSLLMLEQFGRDLQTADVARTWLRMLPFGAVFTAERAAYITLANESSTFFAHGQEPDFDLAECSDNQYNDWIGAQIRTDVYGWVCPGDPTEAARLAAIDAD